MGIVLDLGLGECEVTKVVELLSPGEACLTENSLQYADCVSLDFREVHNCYEDGREREEQYTSGND